MIFSTKNPEVISVRFTERLHDKILKGAIFFQIASVILLSLTMQTWASAAPGGKSTLTAEMSLPGNARARVVWVQDMGDGRDVDTLGSNLRLMEIGRAHV